MERKEKIKNSIISGLLIGLLLAMSAGLWTLLAQAEMPPSPQYQIKLESTGNCKVYSEGKKVGEGNLFEGFSIDSLIKKDNE